MLIHILFLSIISSAQIDVRYEFLGLGESKTLSGLERPIQVTRQDAFIIEQTGLSVKIKAKKPGFAIIKSRNKAFEVSALSIRQLRTYYELKQKLSSVPGIQVTVKKAKVRVEGELPYLALLERIETICQNVTCDFENAIRVPPYFQKRVRNFLNTYMQNQGFSGGQILFEPNWKVMWPRQKVKKEDGAENLSLFGVESIYSPSSIKLEPGVRVQMLIAEVRKQKMEQIGISWPSQLSAQVLPENGIINPAFLTVNWAEQSGIGKTLASPSLLVKSGGEAEFMAGGEVPIRLVGERVNALQWKRYGILLKLNVRADFSGRMSLGVECEVSTVDGAIMVEGVPGFKTNRVSTHFDLAEARSLVLSGLLKSDQAQATSGLNGFASLPVIGPLFSSQDFRNDQSELIIILRPEIVLPQE